MLLSDDRNLPMPLQKTQISTISFGHSVGTGRTGVRPAPDVPRGCPPHSFLRQEGPANPSAATFLRAVLRLLPTRETPAQQYACWRRRDTSSRRRTMRSRLCGNRGPTYVRANSAASSSVRTVTSRARRGGGLNTKSVMPWELARHNRSSGGTRSHPNVGHETLSVPAFGPCYGRAVSRS